MLLPPPGRLWNISTWSWWVTTLWLERKGLETEHAKRDSVKEHITGGQALCLRGHTRGSSRNGHRAASYTTPRWRPLSAPHTDQQMIVLSNQLSDSGDSAGTAENRIPRHCAC